MINGIHWPRREGARGNSKQNNGRGDVNMASKRLIEDVFELAFYGCTVSQMDHHLVHVDSGQLPCTA